MLWVGTNHWSVWHQSLKREKSVDFMKGWYLKGWFVERLMNYDWKVWFFAKLGLIFERLSCVDMMLGESLESVSEDAANLNLFFERDEGYSKVD